MLYDTRSLPAHSLALTRQFPELFDELPPSILSVGSDAKTILANNVGYLTGIFFGSPADTSGVQLCAGAKAAGCLADCLAWQGRKAVFLKAQAAALRKTLLLNQHREVFLAMVRKDIRSLAKKADKLGLLPAVRMNGTTDADWPELAYEFPDIQFYDYTKHLRPWMIHSRPKNYDITFSYSPQKAFRTSVARALDAGFRMAVVFRETLPERFLDRPVVDGDAHDAFFLHPQDCVLGLKAKGTAKTGQGLVV